MGAVGDAMPDWARQEATVEAMHDVSQGDPFYLRCLIEDLCRGRIGSADELRMQPTGLTAYFDKWWNQVRGSVKEEPVRDLLRLPAGISWTFDPRRAHGHLGRRQT